ncbi:MAG TPA: RNA polymerase sigma factor [Fimbriimonas sp.]|nr:RNA polymerase sigma factor [Fimbriimonas sp.]
MTNTQVLNSVDHKRFNELMEGSRKKVYNMAFRLSGSRPDAEDLTQEAFVRAYKSFGDYEGDRPFENWIFRIVTRLYLDMLRSRRRRVQTVSYDNTLPTEIGGDSLSFEIADNAPSPEQRLIENAYSEPMEQALASLSPDQRELILLADVEQVPYAEIAERLGTPVGTVRSRLHRTHKALRIKLEQARSHQALRGNRA